MDHGLESGFGREELHKERPQDAGQRNDGNRSQRLPPLAEQILTNSNTRP